MNISSVIIVELYFYAQFHTEVLWRRTMLDKHSINIKKILGFDTKYIKIKVKGEIQT